METAHSYTYGTYKYGKNILYIITGITEVQFAIDPLQVLGKFGNYDCATQASVLLTVKIPVTVLKDKQMMTIWQVHDGTNVFAARSYSSYLKKQGKKRRLVCS